MFFVVDKSRLQRLIALTRDDRRPSQQGRAGLFFRIEASGTRLKLTGRQVEAEFPATVYEEGVLFLRITLFRRALQLLPPTEQIAVQVRRDGLHIGDVTLPLERNDMLLYADSARAPTHHPDEAADDRPPAQGSLFEEP
jgi:hypothetical protein